MKKIIVSSPSEANTVKKYLSSLIKLFQDNKDIRVSNQDLLVRDLKDLRNKVTVVSSRESFVSVADEFYPTKKG
jgi:hypothetical protein